jgi:hypothetical protein
VRPTSTIATIAGRVSAGEPLRDAAADFLDEFALIDAADRQSVIEAEPQLTSDPRVNAYLGARAEHLAAQHGLDRPAWFCHSSRFLDRFWFVSSTPGFRAIALAQAPAAFKRRGVFVPERSLQRV